MNDTSNNFIAELQEESKQWQLQDKGVLSALQKLGGRALAGDDALVIARNIHAAFDELKQALKRQNRKLGDFCVEAGLSSGDDYSRELHRLMLAPDADPALTRPRKSARKYLLLIEAMAKAMDESLTVLAERMLRGTTMNRGDGNERSEVETIQATLQRIIDIVDEEFGLYRTFMETARNKVQHATSGGDCRWPQWPGSHRQDFYKEPTERGSDKATREQAVAKDLKRAYWESPITKRYKTYERFTFGPTPSGCLQDDSFFFVPHCHLGQGDGLNMPLRINASPAQIQDTIASLRKEAADHAARYGCAPRDEWDEQNEHPVGQTSSMTDAAANYHAWLIIYPSPDNSCVMPMIYMAVEECGPIIVPLDAVALSAMGRMYWSEEGQPAMTWLDHIKRLLLNDGASGILANLRRTAPWLAHNPLLKMERQSSRDMTALKALYTSLGNGPQATH